MRLIKIFSLLIFYPLICGFTFNYEILTACEIKHPNDFIARVVCNNKEEKILKQKNCADSLEKDLDNKFTKIKALVELNKSNNYLTFAKDFKDILNLEVTYLSSDKDPSKKILVSNLNLKCDSGYSIYINIHGNSKNEPNYMSVWRKELGSNESNRLKNYEWSRLNTANLINQCDSSFKYNDDSCRDIIKISNAKLDLLFKKLDVTQLSNVNYGEFINNLIADLETNLSNYNIEKIKVSDSLLHVKLNPPSYFTENNIFDSKVIEVSSDGGTYLRHLVYKNNDKILYSKLFDTPPKNNISEPITKADDGSKFFYVIVIFLLLLIVSIVAYMKFNTNFFSKSVADNKNLFKVKKEEEIKATRFEFNRNLVENILDDDETIKFKAKYPFVKVQVPLKVRMAFINECKWLENKIGHFPSEEEQIEILRTISKDI